MLEDSGIDTWPAPLPLNGGELAMLPRAGDLPLSVEEIYGSGTQLIARLVLSDGKRAELRPGKADHRHPFLG